MKFKIKSLTIGVILLGGFSVASAQNDVSSNNAAAQITTNVSGNQSTTNSIATQPSINDIALNAQHTINTHAATNQNVLNTSILPQTRVQSANGLTELQINSPDYNADKWYRDSAERNAIYREVFYMAGNIIKLKVAQRHLKPQQWGVVMDIDETILDNSAWDYQHDIKGSQQSWEDFAAEMQSVPTPGVKQFVNDVHQMGGYVNLVSNRPIYLEKATETNLKIKDIYFDQVLLDVTNTGTSFVDKNPRFTAIINGKAPSILPPQKILAWFGDNIQDFPGLKQASMIKQDPNNDAFNAFGTMFFAMPNPMYGSWESNQFN